MLYIRAFLPLLGISLIKGAHGNVTPSQMYPIASASIHYKRFRRSGRLSSRNPSYPTRRGMFGVGDSSRDLIQLASSRTKKSPQSDPKTTESQQNSSVESSPPDPSQLTYQDLTPFGRFVAGTVEVALVTIFEYMSGLVGGYVIGSVVGSYGLFFRPLDTEIRQPFFKEVSGRFLRMNNKSVRWGRSWGGISAAFGGFRVASKVVRGGVNDEWNNLFGTMAAGAFFSRAQGPQAMLQTAIMYGGMVYLLSGKTLKKQQPFEYEEQPVSF